MRRLAADAPRGLYYLIVIILGLALLGDVAAWIAMVFSGHSMPDGLQVLCATIAGGLVGALTMSTGSDTPPGPPPRP